MESIGQLTGGVAHDFTNLLAVILGSLTLLRKNLLEDPRTSRLIDGAIQGAQRGANLTRRLLAFARRQEVLGVATARSNKKPLNRGFCRLWGRLSKSTLAATGMDRIISFGVDEKCASPLLPSS